MNKLKQMQIERKRTNTIRPNNRSGAHLNCFRYNPGNTDEHEDMKFKIFKWLRKKGYNVMTEAIFNNGKRCDVIDLANGIIYEVLHSEKLKECIEKVGEYPKEFEVRFVKTNQEFKEELLL